jgi:hypothetical protein
MCKGIFPQIEHDPDICLSMKDLRWSGDLGFARIVFSSSSFSCGIINGWIVAFEFKA